jgi:phosphate transport system protein
MTLQSRSLLTQELTDLNNQIQRLANMADEALDLAMDALTRRDVELARSVVINDEEINKLRFDIEQGCLLILATQQPFATDLRMTITAMHLATELERIGDHAAGIARLVDRLKDEDEIDSLHKLPKMAKRASQMIKQSIQAYLESDPDLAQAMVKRDDKLDKQYRKLFRETLEEMRDDDYIRRATYLIFVGHNLERIGDRATNIAERVIFMVTGEFVEFEVSADLDPFQSSITKLI